MLPSTQLLNFQLLPNSGDNNNSTELAMQLRWTFQALQAL
jgi:hypothetical protein